MKDFLNNLKKAWYFVGDEKKSFIPFIILNLIIVAISIIVPILSAKVIVALTSSELRQLFYIILVITIVEIIRNTDDYFRFKVMQKIFRSIFVNVQTAIGREVLKMSNKSLDEGGTGIFIERLNNDTYRISSVFNEVFMNITETLRTLGIFVAIFIINKWMFLFVLGTQFITFFLEKVRIEKRNKNDKEVRKEREKVTSFSGEVVRGAKDIKMLNAEDNFLKTFKSRIITLNDKSYKMNMQNRWLRYHIGNTIDILNFLKYVLMIIFIKVGTLSIPNALVINNYTSSITYMGYIFGSILEQIKEFNLSCERIFEIIDGSDKFVKETFNETHLKKVDGNFEFKNVSFKYDKKSILKNLNFKVNANETVAFVGKSGAGKTTIFNLLCKMYDNYKGTITIDGVDIRDLDRESIRGNITIISQNPYIFNLSIKDNLKLVKANLTNEEMIKACKMAALDDFINSLPDGYNTIVGEGGVTLSGGQKQRLAIARAFVQKTEIILFDEATSALDNETQSKIQEAINNLQKDYTILIIAHRLSTIKSADRILFIDDGKVIAEGSHKKLMKTCKEYKELYEKEITK